MSYVTTFENQHILRDSTLKLCISRNTNHGSEVLKGSKHTSLKGYMASTSTKFPNVASVTRNLDLGNFVIKLKFIKGMVHMIAM